MARIEGVEYTDAILCSGWPRHGIMLARSAVAERVLREQFPRDPSVDAKQWWPARVISIEEYVQYYARTLVKFRPKFDAVAVVFLRPWWSAYVAEDGVARTFELEAVEATDAMLRPLFPDPAPPAPVIKASSLEDLVASHVADADADHTKAVTALLGSGTGPLPTERKRLLIKLPLPAEEKRKKLTIRFPKPTQVKMTDDDDGVPATAAPREPPLPPRAPPTVAASALFADGLRIAQSLVDFATKHLPAEPATKLWQRRKARLDKALKGLAVKRTAKLDVSTAPLDVAHYPPQVLHLDWDKIIKTSGPIDVDAILPQLDPPPTVPVDERLPALAKRNGDDGGATLASDNKCASYAHPASLVYRPPSSSTRFAGTTRPCRLVICKAAGFRQALEQVGAPAAERTRFVSEEDDA